jgi:8-oxo-dGTP pyrophosphatase MutT (NUDIX family)
MSQLLPKRATARLFIFDPSNRLLLIRYVAQREVDPSKPGVRSFWFTPGGGLEPGESARQAAARELLEETGLTNEIGPEVAHRTEDVTLFRKSVCVVERYFIVRTDTVKLDTSLLAQTEGDEVLDVRWWTLQDLASTEDCVEPPSIVKLAQRLAGGDIPASPVNFGPNE